MALVLADRVKDTTTTTGTGAVTLSGTPPTGFQSFSVIGNGNTTFYTIAGGSQWEVGVGTYTASGTTLSRDTVLESSNSGSLVDFSAGVKDVFVTYPAERAVVTNTAPILTGTNFTGIPNGALSNSSVTIGTTAISLGGTSTTLAGLTTVTLTQDPTLALEAATKQYVDTLYTSGIHYHEAVKYEVPNTTGNLNATYNNGSSGVGATLTNAGTQTAFTPDGVVAQVGDRILIYNQTNAYENGVYTVTTVGSGSTNWVLTRATDANTYNPTSPNGLGKGDAFFVTSGNTGAGETYECNTVGTITFGTTAITFVQISSAQVYQAGTGLTLTNTTFSLTSPVATNLGGTGLTTFTAANNAIYSTSASALTAGTLPITAGGTGATTDSGARTALGLGSMATQTASNVAITGGTIETTKLQAYRETVVTVTPAAGTATLDLSLGNVFTVTLTASSTALAFSNPPSSGVSFSITLIVKQDGSGNRLLTYPASCKFTDSVNPVLATGANKTDVITFFTVDGGTTYFGGQALANLG